MYRYIEHTNFIQSTVMRIKCPHDDDASHAPRTPPYVRHACLNGVPSCPCEENQSKEYEKRNAGRKIHEKEEGDGWSSAYLPD